MNHNALLIWIHNNYMTRLNNTWLPCSIINTVYLILCQEGKELCACNSPQSCSLSRTNYIVEFLTILDSFYWPSKYQMPLYRVEGGEVGYNVHKTETRLRPFDASCAPKPSEFRDN